VRGKSVARIVVLVILAGGWSCLQAQERNLTVLIKGNLTTRTSLFLNPNAPDPDTRAQALELTDFLGSGIEIKYLFPRSNLAVSVSAEYLRFRESNPIHVSFQSEVPAEDGYIAVPVELTGYFIIPASGQTVKMFIGGGGGVYFGRRQYTLAGAEAALTGTRPGFGIHVLGGVSYHFTDRLSLVGEMKFRDLQFRSTNAFQVSRVLYQGSLFPLSQTPFESSVQTDGIVFQLGVGVSF
jgi:hypothetical protein